MDIFKRFREIRNQNMEKKLGGVKRPKPESLLKSNQPKKEVPKNVLIMDSGSYSMKIGYSRKIEPNFLPNHIMKAKSERKRFFIADQIEDCRDLSGLFYVMPYEKGYLSKFDVQKTIWDYTFNNYPIEDSLILTQPILNFKHVQEFMDEIFFEEYDVKSLLRVNAPDLSYYQYSKTQETENQCCVVVDSGFSFTHVVPYINGKKYSNGIVRMDIGGKLLTNYLKDILSYRQLHVMEETYVINQVKEDLCFASLDFKKDMLRARTTNDIIKTYVLPDFHNIRRGYVKDEKKSDEFEENCQILKLNNERICVPEVLMRPSIITGLDQAGLPECVYHSILKCPKEYRNALSKNIVVTGGNAHFPGFKERLEKDVRILLPNELNLNIFKPSNPLTYAWEGGKSMSMDARFRSKCVTKQQYEEYGSHYVYQRFNEYTELEKEVCKTESSKRFSYLDYWKNEGVDIIQKSTKPADVEFILEGDDIEQFDQKFVTVDFEIENKVEENVTPKPVEVITKDELVKPIVDHIKLKKRKIQCSLSNLEEPIIEFPSLYEEEVSHTDIFKEPIKVNSVPQTKPYKHYIKTAKLDPKQQIKTNLFTLGNSLSINGNSYLVPSTSTNKPMTLNHSQFVNIVPQKLITKGVTFQIIPYNTNVINGANIYLTKK